MQGGNEPILTADGKRITDSHGRVSRVTSAGPGPSVDRYLLMGYLPRELAGPGTELQVMYMNELFPVRRGRHRAGLRPRRHPAAGLSHRESRQIRATRERRCASVAA